LLGNRSRFYASKVVVPENTDYNQHVIPGYESILKDEKYHESAIAKLYTLEYAKKMAKHKSDIKGMVDLMKKREGDTGSSAVQIGTLTVKIKYLTDHMRRNRKDKHCLRSLLRLVHRRQKVMKYLRRKDFTLYHQVLSELKLRPLQDKKYLQRK
jgi:small subunit ribosomal protein S15